MYSLAVIEGCHVFGSGFCHLCSFWKIRLSPTYYGLKHAEHAAAQQIFLGDCWCLALWTYASPPMGGFQGGHGKANLLLGAVPAQCRNAPLVCTFPPIRLVFLWQRNRCVRLPFHGRWGADQDCNHIGTPPPPLVIATPLSKLQ